MQSVKVHEFREMSSERMWTSEMKQTKLRKCGILMIESERKLIWGSSITTFANRYSVRNKVRNGTMRIVTEKLINSPSLYSFIDFLFIQVNVSKNMYANYSAGNCNNLRVDLRVNLCHWNFNERCRLIFNIKCCSISNQVNYVYLVKHQMSMFKINSKLNFH